MTIFFHQTVEFLRFDLFQKLRIASQYIPDWNNNRNTGRSPVSIIEHEREEMSRKLARDEVSRI